MKHKHQLEDDGTRAWCTECDMEWEIIYDEEDELVNVVFSSGLELRYRGG